MNISYYFTVMQTVLLIGVLVFASSSIFFYIVHKKSFNTAFLVSFITFVSYLVMREGTFVFTSSVGDHYWTRWLFYSFSCSLLMYQIGDVVGLNSEKKATTIYLTGLVMITGIFASVLSVSYKWVFFGVSSLAYILLFKEILSGEDRQMRRKVMPYTLLGWSSFPLVFLLSPEGLNVLTNQFSAALYLCLDVYTKIVFYLQFSAIKK